MPAVGRSMRVIDRIGQYPCQMMRAQPPADSPSQEPKSWKQGIRHQDRSAPIGLCLLLVHLPYQYKGPKGVLFISDFIVAPGGQACVL